MKTKAQKQTDIKEAKEQLGKSKSLVFADFGKMSAEDLRQLRREMKGAGARFTVIKKRLLNVLFKEEGIDMDARGFEGSVGTIFSEGAIDTVSGPLYRKLQSFGADSKEREAYAQRILGGYDLEAKSPIERETVLRIGTLPPREALLGQFLGMLVASLRAFMYILDQKSQQAGPAGAAAPAEEAAPAAEAAPAEEATPAPAKTPTESPAETEAPAEAPAETKDETPTVEEEKTNS